MDNACFQLTPCIGFYVWKKDEFKTSAYSGFSLCLHDDVFQMCDFYLFSDYFGPNTQVNKKIGHLNQGCKQLIVAAENPGKSCPNSVTDSFLFRIMKNVCI